MVLHLGMMCDSFKSLPGPGGMLDQDSYLVWLLTLYLEAKVEKQKKEAKDSEREAKARRR